MLMASLSERWTTTSWIDQSPGPGRAVSSARVNPATAARSFAGAASNASIVCGVTAIGFSLDKTGEEACSFDLADAQGEPLVPLLAAMPLGDQVHGVPA